MPRSSKTKKTKSSKSKSKSSKSKPVEPVVEEVVEKVVEEVPVKRTRRVVNRESVLAAHVCAAKVHPHACSPCTNMRPITLASQY